ncbi:hypothetical protein NI17_002170 [Thermobifida halotolerans]|uniref:Uncharacterized protein n=1 Tax=Thermobifida halotolerans TaxID=483545 RepID=A0A399G5H6_9ACTN|nr:hypothetical protein [Thermobifida halotolerans]UOE20078.1 hypothetical protein NI17_002170 [Thermobifida halotolerans]
MKIYADRPLRLCAQLLCDVLALAWIALWVRAAFALHETLSALARPDVLLEDAGEGLTTHMETAAETAAEVPFVGERLSEPFESMGATGEDLSAAGVGFQQTVADFALSLSLLTAVLPLLAVLGVWLPPRIRWIRRAAQTRRLRAMPAEAASRLLALRALAAAPVGALGRVHSDPVGAWRSGDEAVVEELAALELRRLGLRR